MSTVHALAELRNFDDGQPLKHGVWFSDHLQVSLWHLNPGQSITTHRHPRADDLMVVVAGTGEYLSYPEEAGPNSDSCYEPSPTQIVVPPACRPNEASARRLKVGPGSIVVSSAGDFHGIVNTGTAQLVIAVATGPDITESTYVTR